MILETRNLTKKYGKITAVDRLNLAIPRNSVFGILGPNGSGKTTTLGLILDVIEKTAGSYEWHVGQSGRERKKIGAILETPAFYPYLSGEENLKLTAMIKGVSPEAADVVLEKTGLSERKRGNYNSYSLGMKQRLAIAAALISSPEVLILDEPTNGLDPKGIVEIREMIRTIASEGRTIILASHLLHEVQQVCTDFCVLDRGRLIYTGKVEDLTLVKNHYLVGAPGSDKLAMALQSYGFVKSMHPADGLFEVVLEEAIPPELLTEKLAGDGIYLNHLSAVKHSLEKKFIEILSGKP